MQKENWIQVSGYRFQGAHPFPFVDVSSVSLCHCLSVVLSVSRFLFVSVLSFTLAHCVRLFPLCLALSFSGSHLHVWRGRRTSKYAMMRHARDDTDAKEDKDTKEDKDFKDGLDAKDAIDDHYATNDKDAKDDMHAKDYNGANDDQDSNDSVGMAPRQIAGPLWHH